MQCRGSRDGRVVVSLHSDGALCVWDAVTLVMVARWEGTGMRAFEVVGSSVGGVVKIAAVLQGDLVVCVCVCVSGGGG